VPLNWPLDGQASDDIEQLALSLKLPVLMVVGLRLGCLNHAILTAKAIIDSGLPLLGWVANHVDPNFDCVEENIETLNTLLPAPKLMELEFIKDAELFDVSSIARSDFIQSLT